jgi:mono/diheme cytochrome c family protein
MKRLAMIALGLLSAWPLWAQTPTSDGRFGSPVRFTEATGEATYQAVCAGCHMADGRGASGAGAYPALSRNERLVVAGYPIGVVLRGQRAMPSFARYLSDRQIADVVDYVRQNFGNTYSDQVSPDDVHASR